MGGRSLALGAGLALAGLAAGDATAGGWKTLAKDLAVGAARARVARIAVLPFVFVNRPVSSAPWIVSERLTTELTSRSKVQVVERSLLAKVLSEHRLGLTGALDASNGRRLGKLLNVDAVLCGTIVALEDDQLELNARLIRPDGGEVVAAAKAVVAQDWTDPARDAADRPPERGDEAPPLDLGTVSLPEELYRGRCAGCHGVEGEGGRGPRGPLDASTDLTRASVQRKPDELLTDRIEGGGDGMPAARLNEHQVASLVRLVRRLGQEGALRRQSRTAGGKLFERHCAVCHGFDGQGSHLAAGLFEAPLANLDLTTARVRALDDRALGELLAQKKRRMIFRVDLTQKTLTEVWLYLQALSKR